MFLSSFASYLIVINIINGSYETPEKYVSKKNNTHKIKMIFYEFLFHNL